MLIHDQVSSVYLTSTWLHTSVQTSFCSELICPASHFQVEQQLIDLQQKYKELEDRTQKDAQAAPVPDEPQSVNLAHLGAIAEEDDLPMGVADRRGRSLGGADGHASVKALKAQVGLGF
jgi:hypothetical protein